MQAAAFYISHKGNSDLLLSAALLVKSQLWSREQALWRHQSSLCLIGACVGINNILKATFSCLFLLEHWRCHGRLYRLHGHQRELWNSHSPGWPWGGRLPRFSDLISAECRARLHKEHFCENLFKFHDHFKHVKVADQLGCLTSIFVASLVNHVKQDQQN